MGESIKAVITGITGQDGPYLAKLLLEKGYKVYGTYRRLSTPNFWRLKELGIYNKVKLLPMDLVDMSSITQVIRCKPDELYNLAAQSFVEASFEQPLSTGLFTGLGVTNILEAIKQFSPKTKFYQASTSEMFGSSPQPQDEDTPFNPVSPYATSKLYAHHITKIYREAYGLFACSGILFNHESPLRGEEFVTRKISKAVAEIWVNDMGHKLYLGNIFARRDWGYAPDYVRSMWMMLNHTEPDDYVISTGESHTVKDFLEVAFNIIDSYWQEHVITDDNLLRPIDIEHLRGNPKKARKVLGWKPTVNFRELVRIMVEADVKRLQNE